MSKFCLSFIVIAALATAMEAAPPKAELVPPEMQRGGRLVLRDCACSIEKPSPSWLWVRPEGSAGRSVFGDSERYVYFFAVDPDSRLVFGLYLSLAGGQQPDEPFGEVLRSKYEGYVSQQGGEVQSWKYERSDIPWPGSFRFELQARYSSGEQTTFGYAAGNRNRFVFQHVSLASVEDPRFVEFVSSVKFEEEILAVAPAPNHSLERTCRARCGSLRSATLSRHAAQLRNR